MMKKVWKRALACILVLVLVAGYLPTRMNQVVNAEDSDAQQETALEFGDTDTYLQLSNPLSAAPQAIEATVNMPEIEKEWVLCAAEDIAFEKGTVADFLLTTGGTETVEPVAGTNYAQVQLTNAQELLFSKKFDVTIPYTYSNDDVALSFWMYSDTAVTIDAGFIELTSSGTNDHNERCWGFSSNYSGDLTLKTGWNYVELPVSKMIKGCTDADFNLQEANYIRWHSTKFSSVADDSTITIGLTDMKLVVIEEENYGNYADGEWTIADVSGTIPIESIGQSLASKPEAGSKALEVAVVKSQECINKDFISSMTIPDDYKLTGTANSGNGTMSGEDADNLYVDFWLYAPAASFNAWFRLYDDTTEILRYGLHTASIQQGWNHIQIPLSAFTYVPASDSSDFSSLNRLTIAAHGNVVEGTYYFSNFKIIDTDILEVSDYADGEWTIAEIGDTDVSVSDVASAENGPETGNNILKVDVTASAELINQKFVSSMTIPADYKLTGTANSGNGTMSGEDADNLYVDFWLYAPTASFNAWFRLYDDTTEILRYGLHTASIQQGWNHMQIPLSAFTYVPTSDSSDFSVLDRLTIASHGNVVEGTYYIGDIKIIDTDILESLDYADGEWTIAEIGDTDISASGVANAENGPKTGTKIHAMDIPTVSEIQKTLVTSIPNTYQLVADSENDKLSGDDIDNLMLDFWLYAPNGNLKAWLRLLEDGNSILRFGLHTETMNKGWNHIQIPLSKATYDGSTNNESDFSALNRLTIVKHSNAEDGTYYFSDIKIIDTDIYTPIEESVYDATTSNYMIFSNLNATEEENQSALFVTKTGNPAFVWGNTQYTLNQNVCTGEDVKIKVVRFASGYIQFYINDEPVGISVTQATALNAPTTAHCIGGDATGGQIFNGSISNLKVYSDTTLSTCIGNWALSGNIQNVNAIMSDSSDDANTAVFRGSRADDWSDYIVPTEVEGAVGTLVTSSGLSYTGSATEVSTAYVKQGTKTVAVNYRKVTSKDSSGYRVDFNCKALEQIDLSSYNLEDLAIEFWMKCSNKDMTSLPGGVLRVGTDSEKYGESPYLGYDCTDITLTGGEWTKVTLKLKDAVNASNISTTDKFAWIRFLITGLSEGDEVYVSDMKIVKAEEDSWSLVYIPDMENLTSNDTYNETWKAMAQWIADNAETENIQHVIGGGDTTLDNSETAYARALEGYELFMNDVSWSTMVGYNDYAESYTNRDASNYQATFGEAVIKASAANDTYKGSYVDSENKSTTENSYYRFNVNGVKWMILQLEYAPRTEVLEWADGIMKEYPLDNVILTTQGYLNGYGSKLSMGTTTWNALSDNQNIKMILCGYSTNETGAIVQATETYSDGTGSVPVLMMNAQDLDAGEDAYYTDRPLGMISILRFSPDGSKVAVQYYSPTEGKSFSPDDNYGNANSNNILLTVDAEVCTPIITPCGEDYDTTFEAATAPNEADIPTGYIFAGWFTDEACTTALKASDNVETAYAKFVDAEILSVKAQVRLDKVTDDEGNVTGYKLPEDKTDMRFVTTVDSTKYQEVGFEITAKDSTGQDKTIKVGSEFVYEYLYAVGKVGTEGAEPMSYTPSDTCSPQSTLFKTFTVTDIPVGKYGETFTVRAYWITQDGTTVYGDSSVKTVEAGEP